MHTYVPAEFVFCSKTFDEHIKSPDTDIVGLAQITIEQSLYNATNTQNLVLSLLKDATGPAPLKDALITCKSSYKTLVESFQQASSYFSQNDYQKVIDTESPGSLAQDKCHRSLTKVPRSDPLNSLVESDSQMRILVSMSLVTAKYLVSP
ncbi:uncharacterized protein LOC116197281 [Punica granatum]|nr:uncharacterized protein LOC116197281 [Punica granatum]